ncbi:MAG: hypothetical protein GXO48_01780 [Chlorobi bacterium]|nr:hypothetical protein [Chlorobiota bacterium]
MRLFLFGILVLFSYFLNAQDTIATGKSPRSNAWKERIFFTGNIGMAFGSSSYFIGADPGVGYMITERWHSGVQFAYYLAGNPIYTYRLAGPIVFTRFFIIPNVLFLSGQYEQLRSTIKERSTNNKFHMWHPALLLGGGMASYSGGLMLFFQVMYDVLQHKNSLYYNTRFLVFRFGLAFY